MELFVKTVFVVNIILTLTNATVAFYKIPRLISAVNPDADNLTNSVNKVRLLLPLLVALYVLLNCYAYSLFHPGYLFGVTLLLAADIATQLFMARKKEKSFE